MWVLVVYLWLVGGFGWIVAYERGERVKVPWKLVPLCVIATPFVVLVAAVYWTYRSIVGK
jgi:hypothetical protein